MSEPSPLLSSRPRPPLTTDTWYPLSGGRAEGPLLVTESLLDRASRDYLSGLLQRMNDAEDNIYVTYILSSVYGTLYVGVTNNLPLRLKQHCERAHKGFTADYLCTKLLYFEISYEPMEAIMREKQIKNWSRAKKERLIKTINTPWIDLGVFLPMPERLEDHGDAR